MGKSTRKPSEKFVMLRKQVTDTPAWRNLKPGPRALYLEVRERFTGSNNGRLSLSHREAADALNVGRDTAGSYFTALIERGFLVVTKGHYLGPAGIGQSAHYRLTEEAFEGRPATRDYARWKPSKNLKAPLDNPTFVDGKSDTPCRKTRHSESKMSENPTALPQKTASTVSENPAMYRSAICPGKSGGIEPALLPVVRTRCLTARKLQVLRGGRLNLTGTTKLKLAAGLHLAAGRRALAKAKLQPPHETA